MTWFDEGLHDGVTGQGYTQRFEVTRIIHREASEIQELLVFETPRFGRVLALDGVIQTTEGDEFIYHEMLVHVPMVAHGNARRVLIIGGGDGGALREVLRHPVERATMVEIDRSVVDLCREHMPSLSAGAFEDPRADLIIADGIRYVAESADTFDVIIVDSTDPIGPGEVLFTEAFYADCKKRLTPGGVLVTQCGVPFFQGSEVTDSYRRLTPHFADVGFYVIAVPTYIGGFMTLGWATDDAGLRSRTVEEIAGRVGRLGLDTRYYTPGVHVGAFALPGYVAELID